ncbi:MAG: LSU ribosomal protein L7p/L12p (P1/P2), partial [uncultured Thermoleophilia bacterium]
AHDQRPADRRDQAEERPRPRRAREVARGGLRRLRLGRPDDGGGPRRRWRRGRRGAGGADGVRRRPDLGGRLEDRRHQGDPGGHRSRPQGGQGRRRRRTCSRQAGPVARGRRSPARGARGGRRDRRDPL